ncbi:MAG: hypothetical protein KA015_01495 [Spirochaetes bacterium]|nr:hypothetical protein [Spirochaetota bacterium]
MRRIITALLLLFSTSLFSYRNTGEKIDSTLRTLHFNIHFEKGYESNAVRTAEYAELSYEHLSDKFKLRLNNVTDIILYQDFCDYKNTRIIDINYDNSIMAFSSPENKYIVLPFNSENKYFKKIIFHEMTHVFIYNYINRISLFKKKLPSDLEEAFCEYFSGISDSNETMILRDIILSKNISKNSFRKFQGSYFPDSSIISASALQLISERHGEDSIFKLLNDVVSGEDYNDLIEDLSGGEGELSGFIEKKARHDDSETKFQYSEVIPANESVSDYFISEDGTVAVNYGGKIVLYRNGRKILSNSSSLLGRMFILNDICLSKERAAYSVLKNGSKYISFSDFKGNEKHVLIPLKNTGLIKISNCGNYLYYVTRSASFNAIVEFNVHSAASKIIYRSPGHIYDFCISGNNLFVSFDSDKSPVINKIDLSSKTERTIARIKAFDFYMNGRDLYFSSDNDGSFQIYSIDTDYFRILRHTDSATSAKKPFISQGKLYFSVFRNMNWHISEKTIQGANYIPISSTVDESKPYYDFSDADFSYFNNRLMSFYELKASVFNSRFSGLLSASISGLTNQNSINVKAAYKYRKDNEKDLSAAAYINSDNGILNYQAGFYHLKNSVFNDDLSGNMPFDSAFNKSDTLYAKAFFPITYYFSIGSAFYFQRNDKDYFKTSGAFLEFNSCDNVITSEKSGVFFTGDVYYTFSENAFTSYRVLLDIYADISPFSLFYKGSFYKSRFEYRTSYSEFVSKDNFDVSSEIMQKNKIAVTFDFNELRIWNTFLNIPLSTGLFFSRYYFGNAEKIDYFNETGITVFVENSGGLFLYLDCGKTYRYREGLSGGGISFGASFSI